LRVFYPVPGATVTQKFGARNSRDRGGHPGTDFAAPLGTPIVACEDGQVIQAGPASGFGNWIVVKHPDGYYTVYGHMFNDGVLVRSGQQVKGGSRIGKVGNNGVSTGAHCHLEVHNGWPGQRVDPEGWLRGHGAANAPSGGAATTDAADTNAQKQANTPQALGPGASNYGSREEIDTLGGALGHTAAGNTTQASSQQNKAAAPDDSGAQPTVAGSNAVGDVLANARTILRVAKSMGVDKLGGQIGIMTALTESGLKNLPGGDADSAGLFQQRPSQHWGTLAQVTNPNYAAGKFFAALKQGDWHDEAPWLEAQHVQRSAFSSGSNYRAQWGRAQQIVNQIGFATGAWNVGQTGQRTIHQDEMVLPAGVAEPFRAWMTNQGRTPSSAGNVNQSKPSQNFHGPIVALTLSMPVTTAQQLDARTARQFVGHITDAMENDQRLQRIAMDVVGQVSP
jgi:peptidoglycan DL-endopeptidase RipA